MFSWLPKTLSWHGRAVTDLFCRPVEVPLHQSFKHKHGYTVCIKINLKATISILTLNSKWQNIVSSCRQKMQKSPGTQTFSCPECQNWYFFQVVRYNPKKTILEESILAWCRIHILWKTIRDTSREHFAYTREDQTCYLPYWLKITIGHIITMTMSRLQFSHISFLLIAPCLVNIGQSPPTVGPWHASKVY